MVCDDSTLPANVRLLLGDLYLCSSVHLAPTANVKDKACGKATVKALWRGSIALLSLEPSHIRCYILIRELPEAYTVEITIYSLHGSGHCISFEDKATTLPTLTIPYTSCPIKNTLRPTEPFHLTEWILDDSFCFLLPSVVH